MKKMTDKECKREASEDLTSLIRTVKRVHSRCFHTLLLACEQKKFFFLFFFGKEKSSKEKSVDFDQLM